MAVTEDMRVEVEVRDIDTSDTEEIEFAQDTVEQCAASAVAAVNIDLLEAENGTVIFEITGHFTEIGAFIRRWESEL